MRDEWFEWDDRKAASNQRNHNVSFETARLAFADPDWVDAPDPDPDEERFNRLCMHEGRIYVVTYTERGTRTRIISARKASRHEQDLYDDQST